MFSNYLDNDYDVLIVCTFRGVMVPGLNAIIGLTGSGKTRLPVKSKPKGHLFHT